MVVFKATPDAESGKAAYDLATSLNGVRGELAISSVPIAYMGTQSRYKTVISACNGKTLTKGGIVEADWLVWTDGGTSSFPLVTAFMEGRKIIHVVGDFERQARCGCQRSSWRLDAIVPIKESREVQKTWTLFLPTLTALKNRCNDEGS